LSRASTGTVETIARNVFARFESLLARFDGLFARSQRGTNQPQRLIFPDIQSLSAQVVLAKCLRVTRKAPLSMTLATL
jgi:hypothetical protein